MLKYGKYTGKTDYIEHIFFVCSWSMQNTLNIHVFYLQCKTIPSKLSFVLSQLSPDMDTSSHSLISFAQDSILFQQNTNSLELILKEKNLLYIKLISLHNIQYSFIRTDYSRPCHKLSLKKKTKIGFQYQLSLNAGHKYCRMLKESILRYFRPSLRYHRSLKLLFCLF